MSDENRDPLSGVLQCAGQCGEAIGQLSKLFDQPKGALKAAAELAFAVGVIGGLRIPKAKWKQGHWTDLSDKDAKGRVRDIIQFASFAGTRDYQVLLDELSLNPDNEPVNAVVSEYVSGGLEYLADNDFHDFDTTALTNLVPELFD